MGHIHSTGLCTGAAALCATPIPADVRLDSPRRILDAELDNGVLDTDDDGVLVDAYDLDISGNQNGVDVTGRNITLTAGDNGLGEAGSVSGTGGIGLPDNFLEIQVDAVGGFPAVAKGLLNAHDLAADDDKTLGIHLDQVAGDLRIGVVETAGDNSLSTGNVSLRSRAGSIIDGAANGAGDAAADVLGQAIDIDAHGGSIGTAAKDLDIDSLRGSPFACTNVNCANNTGLLNNGTSDAGLAADRGRRRPGGRHRHLPHGDRRVPAAAPGPRGHRQHPHHGPRKRRTGRGPVPDPQRHRQLRRGQHHRSRQRRRPPPQRPGGHRLRRNRQRGAPRRRRPHLPPEHRRSWRTCPSTSAATSATRTPAAPWPSRTRNTAAA